MLQSTEKYWQFACRQIDYKHPSMQEHKAFSVSFIKLYSERLALQYEQFFLYNWKRSKWL